MGVAGITAVPALEGVRQPGRAVDTQSDLRQLSIAGSVYTLEFQEAMPSFSWSPNVRQSASRYADLETAWAAASDPVATTCLQATDLLRTLTDRADLPVLTGVFAPARSSHLVLLEYLDGKGLDVLAARDDWALQEARQINPSIASTSELLRFYGSSYEISASTYDWFGVTRGKIHPSLRRLRQGATHDRYLVAKAGRIGSVRITDVTYPAQKVWMHETHERGKSWRYFADPEATIPVALIDGSVQLIATRDVNPGWDPLAPASGGSTTFYYTPSAEERPRDEAPAGMEAVYAAYYRFTRGGVRGVDVGAPEIDTGQPAGQKPEIKAPDAAALEEPVRSGSHLLLPR